eukprot:tig00020934_g16114.t1
MAFALPVVAATPSTAAPSVTSLRSSFVGERTKQSAKRDATVHVEASPAVFCSAEQQERGVPRRSLLGGLVAALAAGAAASRPVRAEPEKGWAGWLESAGDEAVEDALRYDLVTTIQKNNNAAPVLRLAFHDAGVGGPDGSIRFPDELSRPENGGLQAALDSIKPIKPLYASYSWADFIAVAGAAAVEVAGGPIIRVGLGRKDAPKAGPVGKLPSFEADANGPRPRPASRLASGLAAPPAGGGSEAGAGLRETFAVYGLKDKDIVALSGAHTLGKFTMPDGTRFAWTPEPEKFDNSYFKVLTGEVKGMTLPSDVALTKDPIFKDLVEIYARDQTIFFNDFARSYKRMTAIKK